MSKKSPNVIFKSQYCLALKSRDNKLQSLNYKDDRLKDVDDMINYFSNEKKRTIGMFEYYMGHTRNENYNLVMENGEYATKQDINKIKDDYKKYIENSNLWKGILSFKKEYLDENIDIKTLEQKIAKEVMPQFLKYCGFKDIKNIFKDKYDNDFYESSEFKSLLNKNIIGDYKEFSLLVDKYYLIYRYNSLESYKEKRDILLKLLIGNLINVSKIYRDIIIENILENEKKYYEMNDFYDDVNKILEFIRKQNRLNAIIINT